MKRQKQLSRRKARAQQRRRTRVVAGTVALLLAAVAMAIVIQNRSTAAALPEPQVRLGLDPVLGNPDAPVTIVEYGAFGCTSCRAWHNAGIIQGILTEFPDRVRFIFRDYPVILPAYDHMAAEIAQCALDQSNDAFWKLHDALYEIVRPGAPADQIFAAADQIGLNTPALRTCYEAGTHRAAVDYDLQRGRALGLPGTPSWFVNDQRLFSATPDTLRQMVMQELSNS